MLCSQQLAGTALPLLFRFELNDSAANSTSAKLQVSANLAHAQALAFNYLSDLQLLPGVIGSTRFLIVHAGRHLGFKNLSSCLFKVHHHNIKSGKLKNAASYAERI